MTPSADWSRAATAEQVSALTRTIDPTVAHIARVQDYWLGGKDHFEASHPPPSPPVPLFSSVAGVSQETAPARAPV